MNLLAKAREECNISVKWAMHVYGVTLDYLEEIESLPNEELTYSHFKLYATMLSIPLGTLFDAECDLPLRRGAVLRAYRTLKLLEKKEQDAEKRNLIGMAMEALNVAIPDMRASELPAMATLRHKPDSERIGKLAENVIERDYYREFDVDSPLRVI